MVALRLHWRQARRAHDRLLLRARLQVGVVLAAARLRGIRRATTVLTPGRDPSSEHAAALPWLAFDRTGKDADRCHQTAPHWNYPMTFV